MPIALRKESQMLYLVDSPGLIETVLFFGNPKQKAVPVFQKNFRFSGLNKASPVLRLYAPTQNFFNHFLANNRFWSCLLFVVDAIINAGTDRWSVVQRYRS